MSLISKLVCVQCGASYHEGQCDTCPRCGPDEGILDVMFDLDRAGRTLTRRNLEDRPRSQWRYCELLPLNEAFCLRSGHVGWTPIIEAPRLAEAIGIGRLRLKEDVRNLPGSF